MSEIASPYSVFIVQFISLFFLSKKSTNHIYFLLNSLGLSDKVAYSILSIIFFPGTVVHELAHYITARILLLEVLSITFFPKFQHSSIVLGSVTYVKSDLIRGTLVGVAPIFVGLATFVGLSLLNLFPSLSVGVNIIFSYLIFVISSTMFSSRKDLIDLVKLLPFIVLVFLLMLFLNIKVTINLSNPELQKILLEVLPRINYYLFVSIGINIIIILFLSLIERLWKK